MHLAPQLLCTRLDTEVSPIVFGILKRKNQLSVLIEARSCSKPILMVTDVFNATCYGFVTNEDMFAETLAEFSMQNDLTDEEIETINANSIHI